MKKNIIILLLTIIPLFAFSQKDYKLVEQNPKSKPSWLTNGNTMGAFMIQANKVATLEEAQNNVMASLMSQVASSIAVQVIGEIEQNIDWAVVELEGKTQEQYLEQVKK